jgi:putative transposase
LQERKESYKRFGKSPSLYDQAKSLTEWRASDIVASSMPVWVQRSALRRVDLAFRAFYRRLKSGENPGYPRFKSKRLYDSFSVPGDPRQNCAKLLGKRLHLPKLPNVRVHLYRPIQGAVKEVTVHRGCDGGWSVGFVCDLDPATNQVDPVTFLGIDVGLTSLAVTSDGEIIDNPRHAAKAAAKLARIQRICARRKKGSRSKERARAQVAKVHAHIRNQRLDHARKVAAHLISRYDVIAHEDLNIAGMARGLFAKGINNAGWGILLRCIALKAESAGKHVVAVDPRHTSQTCSGCGALVPKDLSVRIHDCPHCGLRMGRDHNAAVNICALGRSAVTEAWQKRQAEARSESII